MDTSGIDYARMARKRRERDLYIDKLKEDPWVKRVLAERDEARKLAEAGRLGQLPSNQVFPWENLSAL